MGEESLREARLNSLTPPTLPQPPLPPRSSVTATNSCLLCVLAAEGLPAAPRGLFSSLPSQPVPSEASYDRVRLGVAEGSARVWRGLVKAGGGVVGVSI